MKFVIKSCFPNGILYFYCHVQFTTFERLKSRAWWFLNRLCPCYPWTDRQPSLIFQSGRGYPFTVMSSSPPRNGRALSLATSNRLCSHYLWTDGCLDLSPLWYSNCQIQFTTSKQMSSYLCSLFLHQGGSSCCHVNSKPLNSGLQVWDLVVSHVQSITSEPTGTQTQSTFAVPCGLVAKLILPLAADSKFRMS